MRNEPRSVIPTAYEIVVSVTTEQEDNYHYRLTVLADSRRQARARTRPAIYKRHPDWTTIEWIFLNDLEVLIADYKNPDYKDDLEQVKLGKEYTHGN